MGGGNPNASPRSPAALEAKITALETRLRNQADELEALREYQAQREQRDKEEGLHGDSDDGGESGEELELLPPSPGADEARERLQRATARMQRARPHAMALERAMKSLQEIARLELARPQRGDTTARLDLAIDERDKAVTELRGFLSLAQGLVRGAQAVRRCRRLFQPAE